MAIPDVTRAHWVVNIRKFVAKATHLDDLVGLGTLSRQGAAFLAAAVAAGLNILVAGGTQAGKTTLLNCLSAAIPSRDRVVTCEEVARPVAVRFGWADHPLCNLFNDAGLPASPFRTDNFPITTGGPKKYSAYASKRNGPGSTQVVPGPAFLVLRTQ